MMLKVDMADVGVSLDVLAHRVGETTEQATVRFGVGVAKAVADRTEPRRLKTKKRRKAKAMAGMRRVVEPVEPRFFTKLTRADDPRIKLGGRWVAVRPDRMLNSVQEVWDAVERNRDHQGRTRRLPPDRKYLCRRSVFNKVATKRERLWGVAKGAWLGAGADLVRRQKGLNRLAIGKNYLSWTQRHKDKGDGRQEGREHDTTAVLMSRARSVSGALSVSGFRDAVTQARRGLWKYYTMELRRMKRKPGGKR